MTKELKKEIEEYLIAGGYVEQLQDILIVEDVELSEDDFPLSDLEQLKLRKYESDINFLMDNFKVKTLKNICEVVQIRKVGYK